MNRWIHRHPYWSIAFSVTLIFIACLAAGNPHLFKPCLWVYGFVAGAWIGWVIWPKLFTIVLIGCLLLASEDSYASDPELSDPNAGGVAVGVGVIIVGGIAAYWLYKTCQRLFPKPSTNDPPSLAFSGESIAGSWTYDSVPSGCIAPAGESTPTTILELTGFLEDSGQFRLGTYSTYTNNLVPVEDFNRWLFTNGLPPVSNLGPPSYARNGQPVEALPELSFDRPRFDEPPTIVWKTDSAPRHRVVIERSADMAAWEMVLVTELSAGRQVRLLDATQAHTMFYRISQP